MVEILSHGVGEKIILILDKMGYRALNILQRLLSENVNPKKKKKNEPEPARVFIF